MAHGWNSYTVGRRAQWFIPLLAAMLAIVMVPLVGAGASSSQGESATQGVCLVQLDRWSGPDRYATAIDVSRQTYPGGSSQVFIATGENFPDALAVSTLAFKLGGPVLLTRTADLPGTTANEIRRLNATKIRILGGTAAVSSTVETSLKALGTVSRTWGADRYATAVEISKSSFPNAAAVNKVYVAVGTGFPDALGSAPVAAIKNAPLLLTDGNSLSNVTRQEILRLSPSTVYVIGGGGSVSQFVMDRIAALGPNVVAVSGTDRYSTAISVAKHGFPTGADTVFISRGSLFPDALAGGVAAASRNAPILLTPETTLPVSVANELKRLNPSRIVILGGTAAVSDFVAQSMVAAVCGTPAPTTTIPGATTTLPPATTLPPTTTLPPVADITPPTISVKGPATETVVLGGTYNDKGAKALDDVDGDITANIVTVNLVNTLVAGPYTVTYDVVDAAGNPAIQQTRTVHVIAVTAGSQKTHFKTGFKGPDTVLANKLPVPATDPAGITVGPSNRLFIVDSEIEEANLATAFTAAGGNVFETSLDGSTIYNVYDLTSAILGSNTEPTGIAYDANDDVFYVTNDDAKRLYRYSFTSGVGFTLEASIATFASGIGYKDVEGVTVDNSGNIYVIAQTKRTILRYTYGVTGFVLEEELDLAALNVGLPAPKSPEGIAWDPSSGNLLIVSSKDLPYAMYEFTTAGVQVERFNMGSFSPLPAFGTAEHNLTTITAPQGLTFGPASSGGGSSVYIVDGGVDNGNGGTIALERDGVVYEGSFG